MNKFIYIYILFSLLLFCTSGFAQDSSATLFSIETSKEIVAKNDDLVPLTVQLQNNSSLDFSGKLVLKTVDGIQMIGQSADAITMEANSKRFVPVRIAVSRSAPSGDSNLVFALVDDNGNTQAQFTTRITIQSIRKVQLSAYQPNQLMQNVGDSLTVSAQLTNLGNSKETIMVTASFPDLRGGTKVEKRQIFLDAYKDTIISFSKIITRDLLRVERYSVNMAALYSNGELINNVRIGVQNVSGNRTFTDPSQSYRFDSYSSNHIELSGINLFSPSEALQLTAQNEFELLGGNMDVNFNGYLYTHGNSRPLITNSYIDYKKSGVGVRIGNISESLETYVNGRGIKTYLENQEKTKLVEVGVVDNSYNLFGDQFQYEDGNSYTAYAKTILKTRREGEYAANVVYDRAARTNTEDIIAMNTYSFSLKKDVTLGFDLGAGVTRLLRGDDASFEPSLAIGGKLSGRFGKFNINSNNFFSTGYYPGVRKGVLQLNERISRQLNKVNIWAGYTLYKYNPKQLPGNYSYFSSNNTNARYEVGSNFPIATQMSLSISAKHQADEGTIGGYDASMRKSKMNSYTLSESINWRSRNSLHGISLSSENGFSQVPFVDENKFQLRLNGNYNYRIFSLNSFYQRGDFTIMEAYRSKQQGEEGSYRFNVSGSVRKELLNKKLKTQLNVNFNRDSYSGSNWTYSGQVDYEVFPQFRTFANVYVYNYSSSSYSSFTTNVQAGVRYNLPSGRAETSGKKGNLKLFLFHDNNANGIYDQGDTPAKDRIITIGEVSFITLANGTVEYKKIPYGTYTIKFPSQDWFAVIPSSINIADKKTTHNVPLQRTGKVTGKLYYKYDARTSEEFAEKHGGLRVWATTTDGKKTEALTNANGEFTLFLPVGEYTLSVDINSLPKNVYTEFEPQAVKVVTDKTTAIPHIELKIKQRVIEMKKFGS